MLTHLIYFKKKKLSGATKSLQGKVFPLRNLLIKNETRTKKKQTIYMHIHIPCLLSTPHKKHIKVLKNLVFSFGTKIDLCCV